MGMTEFQWSPCEFHGMGLQIREWEYSSGNRNEFPKLNGNQLLFAQIACDVLAPLHMYQV